MIAYYNGGFVDRDRVAVSPDDRGFLFADGVYEVVRVYRGRPFAVGAHARRLARSLGEIRLEWADVGLLGALIEELLARNRLGDADALCYAQVTRGVAPREHRFPGAGTPPTVYLCARRWSPAPGLEAGVGAVTVPDTRWSRCDIKSVGLLANVMAAQQAVEAGAAEALFVWDGVLTEGTHTNVCAVVSGQVWSHPLGGRVLAGVTRAEVAALCAKEGLAWRDEAIGVDRLGEVEELLLLGTTMEVTPVVCLDGRPVGNGRPGPVAARLLRGLRQRAGVGP